MNRLQKTFMAVCLSQLFISPSSVEASQYSDDLRDASKSWPSQCLYPYQGVFKEGVVTGIDCNVSTAVYPGTSAVPLQLDYDGKQYCYYVDNFSNNTLFLPLKSEVEWGAFYTRFKNDPDGQVILTECGETCTNEKPVLSFVIDESGSIGAKNFTKVKSFFSNLVSTLDYVGAEPANASFFSGKVTATSQFASLDSNSLTDLKNSFYQEQKEIIGKTEEERISIRKKRKSERNSIRASKGLYHPVKAVIEDRVYPKGSGTAIGDAIIGATNALKTVNYTNASGRPAEKVIVIFTDGASNTGTSVKKAAEYVKSSGIKTFVIGVGDVSMKELKLLANAGLPEGAKELSNYRYMDTFTDLEEGFGSIARSVCGISRKPPSTTSLESSTPVGAPLRY